MFILFFGVPAITHLVIPAFTAGVIVIGAHHGAYFSEIVRGAIKAVPNAQTESAKAMGMSWWTSLREVLAPQALLHALPASGNQLIITVKDTSLLAVIGVAEVTHEGQIIIANTFRAFETWTTVAAIYLVLTGALALCVRLAERKLGTFLPENTRS
jgi:glutamine transport system permease protein